MRYRVEFIDANGKVYFLRGIDYKPAADAVADKVGTLQQLHAAGERPTPELVAWIRDCRPEWRARMIRAGLVDAHLVAKGRPLAHHLIGWWHALKAKGRTRDHARKSVRRAIAICRGAELRHLADMCVGKVETHLAGMRDNGNGINASTYNAYLQAIRQFTRWMMTTNRADADPLANAKPLERAKVRKECRRERRAMTPDEMRELLARTAKGPERYGAPAADRRLVYWLAAMTGLRVRELKSLRAGAFDLASKPPAVTIQARSAKNATTATLPLPADLAEALRPHMASKTPGASAFDLPHPSNFTRMLADDLDAARLAWIADLIDAYSDARYYQQALALTRQTISSREETVRITRDQREFGVVSEFDMAQAEALLAAARAELPGYEAQFNAQVFGIATLLNEPASSVLAQMRRGSGQPRIPGSARAGVPADLLRNRPDVRSAEYDLAAALAAVGVATADLLPSLTLTGSVSESGGAKSWGFGPAISFPVLNQGALQATRARRIAEAREAEIAWRASVSQAVEDVQVAQSNLRRYRQQVSALEGAAAAYDRAYQLARTSFAEGGLALLDLLDSDRSTASARLSAASARNQAAKEWAALQIATGTGAGEVVLVSR